MILWEINENVEMLHATYVLFSAAVTLQISPCRTNKRLIVLYLQVVHSWLAHSGSHSHILLAPVVIN